MESTTSEVVSGARLAQDAGTALEQIETVSKDLSSMIASISDEAQASSEAATEISELMKGVQDVSTQASEGSDRPHLGQAETRSEQGPRRVLGYGYARPAPGLLGEGVKR